MTTIKLHNTKSRSKEIFTPIDPKNVRMYVCGPTVYDRAHLGNARPVVVFDVLYRLLRHVYGENHVTYVRNFTDVDDKINAEALRRQKAGAPGTLEDLIAERTEETISWYHADMDALGALRPSYEPRATEYIDEMKEMIAELVDSKFAYSVAATIGHNSRAQYVYLDSTRVPSHAFLLVEAFGEKDTSYRYGELSGRSLEDMVVGSRAEVGEGKRNPMDSVLWKPSTIEDPGWESRWGFGRPGWHIECSAMSRKLLGKNFDIHGGGLDLLFPHHENELAQCTACDGPKASAQYWMHNEMLQVEGKKMSKSLGNFFTVRDLLDQGIPGEVIRFVLLSTHYGKPMDWTETKRLEVVSRLDKLMEPLSIALNLEVAPAGDFAFLPQGMQMALANDLNTAGALSMLESAGLELVAKFRGEIVSSPSGGPAQYQDVAKQFLTGLDVLGLFELMLRRRSRRQDASEQLSDAHLKFVIAYELAKQTKDFTVVDDLKSANTAAGVEVRISAKGIELIPGPNFDAAKLDALK